MKLGDLELHHLGRDGRDRFADHVRVLIEQHLLDDLLDRHPVGTGHAAPPACRTPKKSDDHRRRVGRNHVPSDPGLHHATGHDHTGSCMRSAVFATVREASVNEAVD